MMKYLSFISTLIIGFVAAGCSNSDDIDSDQNFARIDIVLTQPEKEVAQSQYDFPVKLLSTAYETQGKGNTMVSPVSASMVLGMVANAIDSAAKGEILNVMNIKDNEELQTYNTYMQKLLINLPEIDKKSKFCMSNGFWLANDGKLSANYNQILSDYYLADIKRFQNFDISVVNDVNKWAKEKTAGAIPEILSESDIDEYKKTVWINALDFNGFWKREFKKSDTKKARFYQNFPDESVYTDVDMMQGYGKLFRKLPINATNYERDAINTVIIPYGNESFLFTAVLPSYNNPDISATLNELTSDYWTSVDNISQSTYSSHSADVYLPKMYIEKDNDLIPALREMGLNLLTNPLFGAPMLENLGYDINLYLDIFRQKAILNLDEKGTQIKVVTVTSGVTASAIEPVVRFDRPFIYFIRERSTGAILLAGVYTM